MSSRDTEIAMVLQRVQDAALDPNVPVAEALRLCVAAGGRLGSTRLRDWARQELNGYEESDELPTYRKVGAAPYIDYMLGRSWEKGRQVTEGMVDPDVRSWINEVPLRASIAEIEAMASGNKESHHFSIEHAGALSAMIARNVNAPIIVQSLYWSVPSVTFVGVVDQVRTRLVELVAEYDLALDAGKSSKRAAEQAVNVVIGSGSTVTMNAIAGDTTNPIASSGPTPAKPRWWERGWWTTARTVGAITVGLATIVGAWAALVAIDVI